MLIFRMWQQACHLSLSLLRPPIHSIWQNVTMPPIDCRMCKTNNCWHSVDAPISHIKTAFVQTIIVWNKSYTHYWHPILHLYVLLFASSSFVTSQFLIDCYPHYLIVRWRVLYGGVCSSSRVCAGVCEGVSIVSCNETCHIDIRSIDD